MTTEGQKACYVIDHLVEALGNEPSSSLRRALILADIDQNPGTTQVEIIERLMIGKSTMNREIEWLFNYGCITRQGSQNDGRSVKLEVCGYSKAALDGSLDYLDDDHATLKSFLEGFVKILGLEKPTLRDAKIFASIFEKGSASKQQVMDSIYGGSASTNHRALGKLVEEGVVKGDAI